MKRIWRKENRHWLLGLGAWTAAGLVWGGLAAVGLFGEQGHGKQPALVMVQPDVSRQQMQPAVRTVEPPLPANRPVLAPERPAADPYTFRDSGQRGTAFPDPTRPRIAVVIDDIGHNLSAPRAFLRLGLPLTYSVLPNLPHTRDAARLIEQSGQEYLIHLPMQPLDYPQVNPGPKPLLLALDAAGTRSRLASYLQELPHAVGANNHMGSAFTQDAEHMGWVQDELAARGMLFLHSRTIATQVPGHIARQQGYRFMERDVFLDHDMHDAAVEQSWQQALRVARRNGQAVAIGHPHEGTLRVLRRVFAKGGPADVDLVPITALHTRY